MTMIDYAKSYLALAIYTISTWLAGVDFWQVGGSSRPIWLIGAMVVLVLGCFWCRAPGRRSRG